MVTITVLVEGLSSKASFPNTINTCGVGTADSSGVLEFTSGALVYVSPL
jgi:hypothetical protein